MISQQPQPSVRIILFRKKNQVMVFYNRESTWTTVNKYRANLSRYDNYFNWTMSYRRDSDVNSMMLPHFALPMVMSYMNK